MVSAACALTYSVRPRYITAWLRDKFITNTTSWRHLWVGDKKSVGCLPFQSYRSKRHVWNKKNLKNIEINRVAKICGIENSSIQVKNQFLFVKKKFLTREIEFLPQTQDLWTLHLCNLRNLNARYKTLGLRH